MLASRKKLNLMSLNWKFDGNDNLGDEVSH